MLFHPVILQAGSEERIRVQLVEVLCRLPFSREQQTKETGDVCRLKYSQQEWNL